MVASERVDDVADAAWDEIRRSSAVGDANAALIYRCVALIVRFDRYPPPDGVEEWDAQAIWEAGHAFLAARDIDKRFARLVAGVADAKGYGRKVKAAVRNFMRDEARKTETGTILRKLEHAVGNDDTVVAVDVAGLRTWSLAVHSTNGVYGRGLEDLVDAAYAVPNVKHAKWSPVSPNRPPLAEPDSLRRVIRAVLEEASAPVDRVTLAGVMQERFPAHQEFAAAEIDEELAEAATDPEAEAVAVDLWGRLTDDQRLIVGVLDLGPNEIEQRTGVPSSTAHRLIPIVKALLREFLTDEDDPAAVIRALMARSADATRRGMSTVGLSSSRVEED